MTEATTILADEQRADRFERYMDVLAVTLRRPERGRMARAYCRGLLMPLERKSVEPLAGLYGGGRGPSAAPGGGAALYQALHHFVADARWSDEALLAAVAGEVLPALVERHGPIRAWIVDDTGLPKKGRHSVGVAPQYCGQLGKVANCQVAVSLSLATADASLPVAFRLYLPRAWAEDRARRGAVYVPPEVRYRSKVELALDQLARAKTQGLPPGTVVADGDYGGDVRFRDGVRGLGLDYAVAIDRTLSLLPPDGKGPLAAKALARALPAAAWRAVPGRPADLRYAALRVRAVPNGAPGPEEWLLIERRAGEVEPERLWLATPPADTPLGELVATATLRRHIERDYLELKQELGLGHYEGRGWRGFHHHASLCIAAYGFLVRERCRSPLGRAGGHGPGDRGPAAAA
jgi:SRSO17 transposase